MIKAKKARVRINLLARSIVNELGSDPPDEPAAQQVAGSDSRHDEAETPREPLSLVSSVERAPDPASRASGRPRTARSNKRSSGLAARLGEVTFQPAEPTIMAVRAAKVLRALEYTSDEIIKKPHANDALISTR